METLALCIGYFVIVLVCLILLYLLIQLILYNKIGNNNNFIIKDNKLFANGKFIKCVKSGNITITDNKVFLNNECIHEERKEFRWKVIHK